jgi:hypothetical protein
MAKDRLRLGAVSKGTMMGFRSRVQTALAAVGLQSWGAFVGTAVVVVIACFIFAVVCCAVALALWAWTWLQSAWAAA